MELRGMSTSFRQQFRAGCKTVLDTFKAANPTVLLEDYDYPPESYHTPCAYVEKGVNETVQHTSGVRTRTLRGNVVLVNKLVSNDQATGEQDVLVDGLLDAFTAAPRAASASSLIQPVSVTDTELQDANGNRYAAAVISVEGVIQEGRV
jgi:hypothetical protein